MLVAALQHSPMWLLICAPALMLGVAALVMSVRRAQLRAYSLSHQERVKAKTQGSHEARLLHPEIDLLKCIGCGACVRACPEEGVLSLLHGQAVVVHGSRCVGHGRCSDACPTGAIMLTLGDLRRRRDLPALQEDLEAVGAPGLFVAGELSGFALVRTAVTHGVAAAEAAAKRAAPGSVSNPAPREGDPLDLLVVGAGPAGLACSLRAKQLNLRFLTIEQAAQIGGTIANYPRKKMVLTQAIDLPLYGRLQAAEYHKDFLIDLWTEVTKKHQLPIRTNVKLLDVSRSADGGFVVTTSERIFHARTVCLSLGRRGSPRRLGVPGEDLPQVSYSLIDAESYKGRRILVVGGGDSAIEAALALAEQAGNKVTISYRKDNFSRLKSRNYVRVLKAIESGSIRVLFNSEVAGIERDSVQIKEGANAIARLPNDEVFIMAGGEPPYPLLERAGVSFDPNDHPKLPTVAQGTKSLLSIVTLTFICAVAMAAWAWWFRAYYRVDPASRAAAWQHGLLRPTGPVGFISALIACALFIANLAYLVRRSLSWGRFLPGSLRTWMSCHVFTGLLAVFFVLVHCGFSIRPTVGGHAFIALSVVILSGVIGRYFYSLFPRAANGTEASLDELRAQLATVSADWDREGRSFGAQVQQQIDDLIIHGRWRSSVMARIRLLLVDQMLLHRRLARVRRQGQLDGIPDHELDHLLCLAKKAYRLSLLVTHYEETAAVLSSWRYFHRWIALLMVLLVVAHVLTAMRYASLDLNLIRWIFRAAP